jgi:formylglycine-generating enzyme required for sulfatase activity
MAGNVAEWVLDYYDFDYYTSSDDWDPKGPKAGTVRLLRGGSFISGASSALTYRRLHVEEVDEAGRGIRCVYPEP